MCMVLARVLRGTTFFPRYKVSRFLCMKIGCFWEISIFIRSVDNRNKPGADLNDIFLFNNIISNLGSIKLPLKGRSFTLSNMQKQPLLDQLDWFFTSSQWTLSYPNTMVSPLRRSLLTTCLVLSKYLLPSQKPKFSG